MEARTYSDWNEKLADYASPARDALRGMNTRERELLHYECNDWSFNFSDLDCARFYEEAKSADGGLRSWLDGIRRDHAPRPAYEETDMEDGIRYQRSVRVF